MTEGCSAADAAVAGESMSAGREMVLRRGVGPLRRIAGESMSAGRLYDRFGDKGAATVRLITDRGVICSLNKKKK